MSLGLCFPFPCPCKCDEPKIQTEALWTEYLGKLHEQDPTIGLNGIIWRNSLPNLINHRNNICDRFLVKYQLREISREDTSQWMLLLQNRFDEIAEKYEHAFKLYDDQTINLDDFGLGYLREIWVNGSGTGSSTSQNSDSTTSKFRDTPTDSNSTINNPTTENVDTSTGSSSSNSNRTNTGHSKEQYTSHDKQIMKEVNELVDNYKQLTEDFLNEFDELFIGILAKWC